MTTRGLTLVELVITISLAAILAIPVSLLLSGQLNGALGARDATVAMSLARREMERLDALNNFFTADLDVSCPSGGLVSTSLPNYAGYTYDLTRDVQCVLGNCCSGATGSQGVKRVQVRATKAGSTDPLATLVTYRTKHVSFGG